MTSFDVCGLLVNNSNAIYVEVNHYGWLLSQNEEITSVMYIKGKQLYFKNYLGTTVLANKLSA